MTDQAAASGRYRTAVIALHWLIAVLIITQMVIAVRMGPEESPAQHNLEALHVSVGLTILLLSVARMVVRLMYTPPPLPVVMALWQRVLAKIGHAAFYVLIPAILLTGWSLRSFPSQPVAFWGAEVWPRLPWFSSLPPDQGMPLYHRIELIHEIMTGLLLWLLVLHVAGALWHQFRGPSVLWRMLPFMRRPSNL